MTSGRTPPHLVSVREASQRLFGEHTETTRRRVVKMIQSGDLTGWSSNKKRRGRYLVSSASLDQFVATYVDVGADVAVDDSLTPRHASTERLHHLRVR